MRLRCVGHFPTFENQVGRVVNLWRQTPVLYLVISLATWWWETLLPLSAPVNLAIDVISI